MLDKEKAVELLDDYLRNALSDEEKAQVEEWFEDRQFRDELFFRQQLQHAVSAESRADLRKVFEKWDKEHQLVSRRPSKIVRMSWLKYIAAACLVGIVAYLYFYTTRNDRLYASYWQPYPNIVAPVEKGGTEELNPEEKAFQLYESGSYGDAVEMLKTLGDSRTDIQFYIAVSEMGQKQWASAQQKFVTILEAGDSSFVLPSQWYLALCFLKQGEHAKAVEQLERIASNASHPYQEISRQLLEKL